MPSGQDLIELKFMRFTLHGITYVRAYRNKWVPKTVQENGTVVKGHSVPEVQMQVGKLLPDGRVVLSKKFAAKYPQFQDFDWYFLPETHELLDEDTYFQRVPRRTPAPDNDEAAESGKDVEACADAESLEDSEESDDSAPHKVQKRFLAHYALCGLAQKMFIQDSLSEVFGRKEAGNWLDYAIYLLMTGGGAAQNYPFWAHDVYLSKSSAELTGAKISRMLKTCTSDAWDRFWVTRYEQSQKAQASVDGVRRVHYCAFDSTSISTYSDWDDANWGYNKQGESLRQINLVAVFDELSGDIVYAFTYEGSINDKSSYTYIVDRMARAGFPMAELMLITDRGYPSGTNIDHLLKNGVHFLTGVPIDKGGAEERWILANQAQMEYSELYDSVQGVSCFHFTEDLKLQDNQPIKVHVHVFKDRKRRAEAQDDLDERITAVLDSLNRKEKVDPATWQLTKPYLLQVNDPKSSPHKTPEKIWVVNRVEVARFQKRAGYFIMKSDVVDDSKVALTLMRMRTSVEAGFNQLKNETGGRRLQVRSSQYRGKLLAFLIATALRLKIVHNHELVTEREPLLKLRMPGSSVSTLLLKLDERRIERNRSSERWVLDQLPRTTRLWLTKVFKTPVPAKQFF